MRIRNLLAAVISAAVLTCAGLTTANAQSEMIDSDFGDECNTVNCSATSIAGFVGSFGTQIVPWTGKFLAEAGNCLRIQMTFIRQPVNLEMTVIAPNALTRYRNDQGGGACVNCPMVKIRPAPQSGFYTVIVSTASGTAANTDFHILFGQYPAGNVNCAVPTPPLS